MRHTLTALLLACAVTASGAEKLTVDQAVALALEHNANVKNARLEVEKAQTRIAAAKTKRLPALSFEAIGGESLSNLSIEVESGDGETTRIDLARTFNMFAIARVTQPLTQLHAIGLGIKLNEAALEVDRERERAARLAIAAEVKRAYFNVLSAQSYAAALQDAVAAWEEADREMNVRVAQKVALEADRLDAGARLASTRLAALTADNTVATAKDQLAYLTGREIEPVAVDAETFTPTDAGVTRRPDVREAQLRVEQARLDLRLKAAERIPDVALVLTNTTPVANDILASNMTSAGVSISYEPFTWGRRRSELTEKRHAVEQAEHALRDRQAAAAVEIAALRRKTGEAAAQIAVRRLEVDAARERLRVVRARFNQQAARADELFDAGASLTQTAAREQEAISAWWSARADYQKAIGEE